LRKLQEIADTVGDIGDHDVVLAFWRRCQPYLHAKLTKNGYDATTISVVTLESECICYEKAKHIIDEDHHRRPHLSREQSNSRELSPDSDSDSDRLSVAAANHAITQTHKQTNQHDNSRMANKECKQCLRLEGKCFNCEGTDYIKCNCPRRWQTKDKHSGQQLLLNLVGMSAAEARLAAIEEGTELGLFALSTAVDPDQVQASSATHRKPIAWTAFPNAKQVILKLPDEPTRSLEGGNAEHLHNSPINTANLTLPKGHAWKLFPGRLLQQLVRLGRVERIYHHGRGPESLFLVKHSNGDSVWSPHKVSHLKALSQYLEVLNLTTANDLPHRTSSNPSPRTARHKKTYKRWARIPPTNKP